MQRRRSKRGWLVSTRSTCPTERRCLRVPPTCIPATIVFSADRSERSHPFAKCILFTFFISRRRFASGPSTQSTWTPHSRFSVVSRISPTPVVPFSLASPSLPIKSSSRGLLGRGTVACYSIAVSLRIACPRVSWSSTLSSSPRFLI